MTNEEAERAGREAKERNRNLQHATEAEIKNYETRISFNNGQDKADKK